MSYDGAMCMNRAFASHLIAYSFMYTALIVPPSSKPVVVGVRGPCSYLPNTAYTLV